MKGFMSRHCNIVFTRDKKVKKFRYDMTDATYSYITNERLIENRKISDILESYIILYASYNHVYSIRLRIVRIYASYTKLDLIESILVTLQPDVYRFYILLFDITCRAGNLNKPVEYIIDNKIGRGDGYSFPYSYHATTCSQIFLIIHCLYPLNTRFRENLFSPYL